jgi:Tol biopolymer transport system component
LDSSRSARATEGIETVSVHSNEFRRNRRALFPDDSWIVYVSNESGRTEVYVTAFPARGGKRQISNAGGSNPHWRPDGKELFYIAPGGMIMSADGQRFLIATTPQGVPEEPLTVIQNWPAALKK